MYSKNSQMVMIKNFYQYPKNNQMVTIKNFYQFVN